MQLVSLIGKKVEYSKILLQYLKKKIKTSDGNM